VNVDTDTGHSAPSFAFWSDEVNMESFSCCFMLGGGSDKSINMNYQN